MSLESIFSASQNSNYQSASQELKPIFFGSGLANCVREQLLSENRGNVALVIDWAIRENLSEQWLDFDALEALAPFSNYRLRNALEDSLVLKKAQKTGKRGRPKMLYYIPSKDTTRRYTTPANLTKSDHLPGWAFENLTNYRAAMYMALIVRGSNYIASAMVSYSRQFLMEFLSVSKKTLRNYEQRFGIYVEAVFSRVDIGDGNLFKLPMYKRFGAFLEVAKADLSDRIPALTELAIRAMRQGCNVVYVTRQPNRYSVLTWQVFNTGRPEKLAYFPPQAQ